MGRKLQRAGIILDGADEATRLNSDGPKRAGSKRVVNGLYTNRPLTGFPWASLPAFDQVKRAGLFTGMGHCWVVPRVDVS